MPAGVARGGLTFIQERLLFEQKIKCYCLPLPCNSFEAILRLKTCQSIEEKRGYDGSLSPIQPQTFVYSIPNKGLKRLKKVFFSVKTASLFFFIEKKEASFVEGLDVPF